MQGEKWMIFLILCFILILALFNVIGSLSMLMIEKKEDVRTLRNVGADDRLIRRIFLFEGWMISGARRFDRYRYRIGPLFVATGVGYYQIGAGSRLLYY